MKTLARYCVRVYGQSRVRQGPAEHAHASWKSPHASQMKEKRKSMCVSSSAWTTILLSLRKDFIAQFHQTSFSPNMVVLRVSCGFLGESRNLSHLSLSLCASLFFYYFTLLFYLFLFFFRILPYWRLKMWLILVTVPQWPLCVKTMTVFLQSVRHSQKKRCIRRYYKCARVTIIDVSDTISGNGSAVTDLL